MFNTRNNEFKIFVAGSVDSKVVKDAKMAIGALVSTISGTIKSAYNTDLRYVDCKDPSKDNNQKEFNSFIKEQADMFVLIIDRVPVGPYSMEELLRACIQLEDKKRPEVYVFFMSSIANDPYVTDLRNVIKTFTGRYSNSFEDNQSLTNCLDSIIRENIRKKNDCVVKANKINRKNAILNTIKILCSIFLIVSLLYGAKYYIDSMKVAPIFFAGGGTVKQYLADHDIDIDKRNDGIYIHVPTGDAWVMLGEEHKEDENMSKNEKKYYPVILAADSIKNNLKSLKINSIEEYVDNTGHIAEMYIGSDSLFVYIPESSDLQQPLLSFISKESIDRKEITALELYNIMHYYNGKEDITVYHTTLTSGTVASFRKAMIDAVPEAIDEEWCWLPSNSIGHSEYNNYNTLMSEVSRSPFISLCSKSYHIKNINTPQSGAMRLLFVNQNREFIEKPLFLYFVLKRKGKNDIFYIEAPIKNFLEDILSKGNIEHLRNMSIKDEYVIHKSNLVVSMNEISAK